MQLRLGDACVGAAAALSLLLLATSASAADFRSKQQGIMSGLGTATSPVARSYQRESNRDRIRRIPSVRHADQLARYWERRQRQRAFAGANLREGSQRPPLPNFATAAPAAGTSVTIRPTVYSYQAALENVLRIAVGDSVRFYEGDRRGSLNLLRTGTGEDGRACRYFRRTITGPDGRQLDFGHACRLRDGSWRFDIG